VNAIQTLFLETTDRRSKYRRKDPRSAVTWPATVISNNKTLQGRVGNISRGGALLYLKEQFEIHDPIRIAIEIPDCHDVITAEGAVVRSSSLEGGFEQSFPFAIAIEFTQISEKDLRFFSGNLAPEWQENYVDTKETEDSSRSKYGFIKYIVFGILFVVISSLTYFIPRSNQQDRVAFQKIEQFDERLKKIELQLQLLQSANVSLQNIEGKIDTITYDILNDKSKTPDIDSFAKTTEKRDSNAQKADVLSKAVDDGLKPLKNFSEEKDITHPQATYHVVKNGENLYRISLNYGLKLDDICKLNNLNKTSQIVPGQKLVVK
jgi:LysM repeat protein